VNHCHEVGFSSVSLLNSIEATVQQLRTQSVEQA
jgi:hypothetical protein